MYESASEFIIDGCKLAEQPNLGAGEQLAKEDEGMKPVWRREPLDEGLYPRSVEA